MKFPEANAIAVTTNTTGLTGFRKTALTLGHWLVSIIVIGIATFMFYTDQLQKPLENHQQSGLQQQTGNEMELLMPANGNSPRISAPDAGYAPSFTGRSFVSHCVYSDGKDLEYPCVKGPIEYYYVHDISGKANKVTYKFVRP